MIARGGLEIDAREPLVPPLLLGEAEDAARMRGHFAIHRRRGSAHELIRDPLGVHKLFFALEGDEVRSASYLGTLLREGRRVGHIGSVPPGHVLRVEPSAHRLELERLHELRVGGGPADDDAIAAHARRVAGALEGALSAVSAALPSAREVFVTLRGLDGAVLAALARARFSRVVGVSFALEEEGPHALEGPRRSAEALGIGLLSVVTPAGALVARLDEALFFGQDWRERNAHRALSSAAIAERLPRGAVLLTSAGRAELMGEAGGGRLAPSRRRRRAMAGLDAGDPEVGVFARHGVRVVQPYLLAAEAYAALPDALVDAPGANARLVRAALGDRVPPLPGWPDEPPGRTELLRRRGADAGRLAARFRELFAIGEGEQRSLLCGGGYRFPTRWSEAARSSGLEAA